jgi:histone H3/H4
MARLLNPPSRPRRIRREILDFSMIDFKRLGFRVSAHVSGGAAEKDKLNGLTKATIAMVVSRAGIFATYANKKTIRLPDIENAVKEVLCKNLLRLITLNDKICSAPKPPKLERQYKTLSKRQKQIHKSNLERRMFRYYGPIAGQAGPDDCNIFPYARFRRVVKSITEDKLGAFRITGDALARMQQWVEAYISSIISTAKLFSDRARRKTVRAQDIDAAMEVIDTWSLQVPRRYARLEAIPSFKPRRKSKKQKEADEFARLAQMVDLPPLNEEEEEEFDEPIGNIEVEPESEEEMPSPKPQKIIKRAKKRKREEEDEPELAPKKKKKKGQGFMRGYGRYYY